MFRTITDANGNIVNYLMAVHVAPHLVVISNPPLTFEEDGFQFSVADTLTAFYSNDPGGSEDDEFDLIGTTPGRWTKATSTQPVPEPGTLLLLSLVSFSWEAADSACDVRSGAHRRLLTIWARLSLRLPRGSRKAAGPSTANSKDAVVIRTSIELPA